MSFKKLYNQFFSPRSPKVMLKKKHLTFIEKKESAIIEVSHENFDTSNILSPQKFSMIGSKDDSAVFANITSLISDTQNEFGFD